ncbi:MAG: kdpC [Hyphomicrobiales bacterium]|nr:kdpC [Hyphomicrobiales bacterium]
MIQHLRPALALTALFTLLTGVAYPLAITGAAAVMAPGKAGGSLISRNGVVVGSALIGQNFEAPRYFHPRPSATSAPDPADASKTIDAPYNAGNSSGSNLGPLSQKLVDRVKGDVAALAQPGAVPADAVTTSGSGLDPHISPATALMQAPRVARERNLPEERVRSLVAAHVETPLFGILGEPRVNVLLLNMALDRVSSP